MSLCIGVDFDNTIACYDQVFTNIAKQEGLLGETFMLAKAEVKARILAGSEGDINWQKLQGQIYGKYMNLASVFPGFAEFLVLSGIKGNQIYIVSHKSEYGHFDAQKISLREEAMKWLIAKDFVGTDTYALPQKNVFFKPTREEKIKKITELKCSDFIDDLQEVFDEPSFPVSVNKYLFDPQHKSAATDAQKVLKSWRAITKELIGEWNLSDICKATNAKFPGLDVVDATLIKGRGNSRIYQLVLANGEKCALKIYPDRQPDNRARLETEFSAATILERNGFSVMKALVKNDDMNWAVYSWIDGTVIESPDEAFISKSADFIRRLKKLSSESGQFADFPEASESCLSGEEIVRQIKGRLTKLQAADSAELSRFLTDEFLPAFQSMTEYARAGCGKLFEQTLSSSFFVPSPSDFGAHNAIKNIAGETIYIDFEYFGWDDPAKLVSDFYWHPAMNLSDELRSKWIEDTKDIFEDDLSFSKRLRAYLPLIGLRWCLILLNEFLPDRLQQRIHADQAKASDSKDILSVQLNKSQHLLNSIKKSI